MAEDIKTVEAKIKWRDVLHLSIKDPELKKHVEGFLDFFEKSSFPYDYKDTPTSPTVSRSMSGQDILARLQSNMQQYRAAGGERFANFMRQMLNQIGIQTVDGKFTISDHDRPYVNPLDGSNTISIGRPPDPRSPGVGINLALAISIGTNYLKGAKQRGLDGKDYPVTVDGVVAHELTHLAYNTRDERLPMQVEGIITTPMGAVQRDPSVYSIKYQKDSNGGYHTLHDKQTSKGGALDLHQQKDVPTVPQRDRSATPAPG